VRLASGIMYLRALGCAYDPLGSAWAAEAFCEPGMEACGTDAGGDAIVIGRQLGVVLLERVQPLGSPLYGVVRPA
jgi:hypothetical protein